MNHQKIASSSVNTSTKCCIVVGSKQFFVFLRRCFVLQIIGENIKNSKGIALRTYN